MKINVHKETIVDEALILECCKELAKRHENDGSWGTMVPEAMYKVGELFNYSRTEPGVMLFVEQYVSQQAVLLIIRKHKAETLLRKVVDAFWTKGSFIDIFSKLEKTMNPARWYIEDIDACQFKEDNGIGCRAKAVRTVVGIACCEEHAVRRERSMR